MDITKYVIADDDLADLNAVADILGVSCWITDEMVVLED